MNSLKIDFENGKLVMDRAFTKNASEVGSAEYFKLQDAMKTYPTFQVIRKTIKQNPSKECYRGLTYEYMENYIGGHESAEERMKEYKELRLLAECHSVRYPHIKKWFLNAYPEVAQFGIGLADDAFENVETVVFIPEKQLAS